MTGDFKKYQIIHKCGLSSGRCNVKRGTHTAHSKMKQKDACTMMKGECGGGAAVDMGLQSAAGAVRGRRERRRRWS